MSDNFQRLVKRPRRLTSFLSALAMAFGVLGVVSVPGVAQAEAGPRVDSILRRGYLICGVDPRVPGFAEVDASGRYQGLDVDICRALAAAMLGSPDKVMFEQASAVNDFLNADRIDVVSRRLTWELRREAPLALLFGPVTFYDGQGFLVSKKLRATSVRQLSGVPICVASGTVFEANVGAHFGERKLQLKTLALPSAERFDDIRAALTSGRCGVYTADVSELGAIRSRLARPDDFDILDEQISKEPLAQLVRRDDLQLFDILRWTVFALINAEELGVTSRNVDEQRKSDNLLVQRLLGVTAGNGKALGLDEAWAYNVIKGVGNYGELFEKNLGRDSAIKLRRGLNRLWNAGGLMFAPPLR